MSLKSIINKGIILSFFAFAGFLLAKSLYYGSVIGIFLAIIGIIAWAMFLYKLSNIQSKEIDTETEDLKNGY